MDHPVETSGAARTLLKDRAHAHIKKLILDGTYGPGAFINERTLTQELQMSKTPIRAAIERLEEQGFVTIAPQRGVVVREMTTREISEHYDLRIALETFVVAQLAGRLQPHDAAQLTGILDRQQVLVEGTDLSGFIESDAEFHIRLAECTQNSEIVKVMQHQRDKVHRVAKTIGHRDPAVPALSCTEHRGILQAVIDGDAEQAAALVTAHLTNGKRFLTAGGRYGEKF